MINATLDDLIINEDELFNRVLALGPGDGINRPAVMVEDAVSISKYGVRETQIDVPDAADFTELEGRANSFLDAHKEPVTEISITFFYDTSKGPGGQIYEGTALTHDGQEIQYYRFGNNREIKRGDTIRIVIRSLEINTTGVIEELDWQPGSVSMSIGAKRYNLLDVVDGARLAAERGEASLGVATPISFRAAPGNPGCVIQVNPYNATRAVGIEVYGSTSSTFATGAGKPSRDTLLYRGPGSRIELQQLIPGSTYYFVARAFDDAGKLSAFTPVVSAVAGYVTSGLIGPGEVQQGNLGSGSVTQGKIAADAVTAANIQTGAVTASKILVNDEIIVTTTAQNSGALSVRNNSAIEVLRLGNISGKSSLPNGTYGLWGEFGTGVYIKGAPRVVTVGRNGFTGYGIGPSYSVAQGSIIEASATRNILSNFTIQPNETFYVLVQPEDVTLYASSNNSFGNGYLLHFSSGIIVDGSPIAGFTIGPGTYSNLNVSIAASWEKRTAVASVEALFNFTYAIYAQIS